jgi:hypothetical protein
MRAGRGFGGCGWGCLTGATEKVSDMNRLSRRLCGTRVRQSVVRPGVGFADFAASLGYNFPYVRMGARLIEDVQAHAVLRAFVV